MRHHSHTPLTFRCLVTSSIVVPRKSESAETHFTAEADRIKEQIQQYQHFSEDIERRIESLKKHDCDAQRLEMAGEMFAPQAEQENKNVDVQPDPDYFSGSGVVVKCNIVRSLSVIIAIFALC